MAVTPKHVAIIMDGNGRWAKAQGLPRVMGHQAGAKTVRMVVEESVRSGIKYLTLFAFSSENWSRPKEEVDALMELFCQYLQSELKTLNNNGVRFRAMGRIGELPEKVRAMIKDVEERSREGKNLDLCLAVSYGGREEIVDAIKTVSKLVQGGEIDPEKINQQTIREFFYLPDVPDPDLLIRTSNEFRISNFLLWQLAYTEIVVTPKYWPEFSKEDFFQCLKEFGSRERRFGLTGEQVPSSIN